jgi:acetyl esterase
MAINNLVKAALKALSYADIDVKKNYKIMRKIINLANYHVLKPLYKTWDHTVTYQNHDIPVRLFLPHSGTARSVLIFFHGGGWVTGNIDSYDKVCANMANITNSVVVSVDYRLAPEHRFPAAPEDCYHITREIFLNTELFHVSADKITIIGDSAGGNLAAAVALMARDRGEFLPARQILIYPATYNDHSENSPFQSIRDNGTGYLLTAKRICDYMELYKGSEQDLQNPYFAPLLEENLHRQPKTLIITAQYDPLRDEGEAYGKRLEQAGNDTQVYRIPDALHGFFSLPPIFPQVKECYQIINDFLSEGLL